MHGFCINRHLLLLLIFVFAATGQSGRQVGAVYPLSPNGGISWDRLGPGNEADRFVLGDRDPPRPDR